MQGDKIIENADLLVSDNRIAGVGPQGSLAVSPETKILDVTGSTILPGFVDLHPHWWQVRRGVLDMQNWDFLAALAYGVTAGRDPQTYTNDAFIYQDLVDMGEMIGPRAYSTGPGIFWDTDFQSLDDAVNIVAKYKKYYRTNYIKAYLVGNREQREFILQASKALEIMPTNEGGRDEKLDLTHIIDGFSGIEHSLPIVPAYKDVDELIGQTGVFYTPTLIVATGGPWAEDYYYTTTEVHDDPKLRRFIPDNFLDRMTTRRSWVRYQDQVFPKLAATDVNIVRAGGKICIGSHGQLQGLSYQWEMWALASGDEQSRSAAFGDAPRSGGAGAGARSRKRRSGKARRPGDSRQRSATGHSQYKYHPLRDEERRNLRRRYAQRSLADTEAIGAALVVERPSRSFWALARKLIEPRSSRVLSAQ
jgi:hypothetical protein